MKVAWGRTRLVAALGSPPEAPALAIGNFDGVHRGHQALISAARANAGARGALAGVLTFDPHPARFFAPDLCPPLLMPLPRRLELLGQAGADFVLVERFDSALAALSPTDFVTEVLRDVLHVGHVVVGHDFSFGRGRAGTTATLATLGAEHGFGVTVIPAVTVDGLICSSTKIREFLLEGRVEGAAKLLGRPPEVTGEVVRGAGRGRTIGIPTANLAVEGELPLKTGIYAARALLLSGGPPGASTYAAAVSVGTNPTFTGEGSNPVTVEAYLLDYPGDDLYGAQVRLLLSARLRDERRFATVDDLLAEIRRDVERTRQLLSPSVSTEQDMNTENELFETETMAELCARQGRLSEAVAIYRRLVDDGSRSAGPPRARERRDRWAHRLQALEKAWGFAAGEEIEPEPIALPRAPGVAVAANDDSVTVAWALPAGTPTPTLELFLIQKTPTGVETSKRALPLPGPSGRVAFAVPALHSALAAVGRHQGQDFVPLARSRRG